MNENKLVVTTPSDNTIVMTRTFNAPARLVFDCFTKPEHVPHWFGRMDGWSMPDYQIDLRVGGSYRYGMEGPNGAVMRMHGEYREITPYSRLVNTEAFDDYPYDSVVTTVLEERDGKTYVTVTAVYESKEVRDAMVNSGMEDGAAISYDMLEEYLQTLK